MEPPGEDYSAIHHEVERLLVDVMRVYGNEFEIGGNTSWYASDGSGDSYELKEHSSRDGGVIVYTVVRIDLQGQRTELSPLHWSKTKKLHIPPQPKSKDMGTTNYERHNQSQKVMIDNYIALQTAALPIQPYVRPDSGETLDIHDEFESMVAYAVHHRSYEHPVDNHRFVSLLRLAQHLDKGDEMRDWRVSSTAPWRASSKSNEDRATE
ncbi:hypothetical protein I8H83_04580 [Candidatus Saccharibacteria bacterium]|nr:hypothetical protein [Candidatus Saccharibacteria bacterium]MBH2007856.1 hypothetical protein [Candidatus Saccharibacteria bacterium]